MKKKIGRFTVVLLFVFLIMQTLSLDAFAAAVAKMRNIKGSAYSSAFWPVFMLVMLPLGIAVFAAIKKYIKDNNGDQKKISKGKYDFRPDFDRNYRDGFGNDPGNIEGLFTPRNSDGLTENEQLMVDVFAAQAKARRPDPVQIKCPNCGAPVMLSDKVVCPYCRTEISNRTVAKYMKLKINKGLERTIIAPEDYNPKRYYDDNYTGYGLHDLNNEAPAEYNAGGSFDSGYDFRSGAPANNFGQQNNFGQPYDSSGGSFSQNDDPSGYGNEWGNGFLGGFYNGDQR